LIAPFFGEALKSLAQDECDEYNAAIAKGAPKEKKNKTEAPPTRPKYKNVNNYSF